MNRSILTLLSLALVPALAAGQHRAGGAAPPSRAAPAAAAQFEFLVGQWELTVTPKVSSLAARLHGAPRLVGTWKAWRAFDGWGIEDELRIMDASGNPVSLAHSMRAYDAAARHWIQTTFDVYRGRFSSATAEWGGGEMLVDSRGTDPAGRAYLARMRFYDISPTGFKARQDRSTDGGQSWEKNLLAIEATKVAGAAPR